MVTSRSALRTYIKLHEPETRTISAVNADTLYVEFANPASVPSQEAIATYLCKPSSSGYLYSLIKVREILNQPTDSTSVPSGCLSERPFPRTLGKAIERLAKLGVNIARTAIFNAATPSEIAASYGCQADCQVGQTNSGIAKYNVLEVSLKAFAEAQQVRDVANKSLEECRNMTGCTYAVDKSKDRVYLIYRVGRVVQPQQQNSPWLVAYAMNMEEWIMKHFDEEDDIVKDLKEFQMSEPEGWRLISC